MLKQVKPYRALFVCVLFDTAIEQNIQVNANVIDFNTEWTFGVNSKIKLIKNVKIIK